VPGFFAPDPIRTRCVGKLNCEGALPRIKLGL
jgi:hypothetical protein